MARASAGAVAAVAGLALFSLALPYSVDDPSAGLLWRSPIWLAISRAGLLAAVLVAWRLAARLVFPVRTATFLASWFAPRRVRTAKLAAGALAALGVVLLRDHVVAWPTQFAAGYTEPLQVALVLGAVDRALSWRRGQAVALGAAALALWIVPGALGIGGPTPAVAAALGVEALSAGGTLTAGLGLPLAAFWVCAAWAVVSARREGEHAIIALAAAAGAWIGLSAMLAATGLAALPRLLAPAAAIVVVLGAVGAVRLVAAVDGMRAGRRHRLAVACLAAIAAAIALQAAVRAAAIQGGLDRAFGGDAQPIVVRDRR